MEAERETNYIKSPDTFIIDGWTCRRDGARRSNSVFSQYILIDVPANGGETRIQYRYALHSIDNDFVGSDFSPVMWRGLPDRYSNLTSRVGLRVDFRKLCRVCFHIFELEVASRAPFSVFVVCGSRTNGKDSPGINGDNAPTCKYHLYKSILVPIARDRGYWLADDVVHSLFLLCPSRRIVSEDELIAAYWKIRDGIDQQRKGTV